MAVTAATAKEVGGAVVETGRVFGQGGTDGLILYALILATFLMFLALVTVMVLSYRERNRATDQCAKQAKDFTDASNEASEALKETATALAASASADMTFKQAQANLMARLEQTLNRLEPRA